MCRDPMCLSTELSRCDASSPSNRQLQHQHSVSMNWLEMQILAPHLRPTPAEALGWPSSPPGDSDAGSSWSPRTLVAGKRTATMQSWFSYKFQSCYSQALC